MLRSAALIMYCVLALLASQPTSARSSLPERAIVQVTVVMHTTLADLTTACRLEPGTAVGCKQKLGQGRFRIHVMKPSSWCDINKIETIGHEMLHTLGMHHGPLFAPPYVSQYQETGCRSGSWWTRPRP